MIQNIIPSPPVPATNPEQLPHTFAAAFNTGDPDAVEQVYARDGVLILPPGEVTTGAVRGEANARMVALGVPIAVHPRHVYVTGDVALLIVDWAILGTDPDGTAVDIRGTATDVARRGSDGIWRYLIDNPFGTAPDAG